MYWPAGGEPLRCEDDQAPKDPREVLRQNRALHGDDQEVSDDHEKWLRAAILSAARRYGVDRDDLRQELELSLLRRSVTLDEGNPGARGWLTRRIKWTALSMRRRGGPEFPTDPADLQSVDSHRDVVHEHQVPLADLIQRIRGNLLRLGLSENESQTVALLCAGVDLPLNDFALMVGRSHASVRKERSRGVRKIKNHFGLTAEEDVVLQGWRTFGSARAAAPQLQRSEDEIHRIVGNAHKKIDELFGEKEV